jgi:tagatose 6-phosphate kinase
MEQYIITVALNAAVDVAYSVPGFGVDRINTAAETQKAAGGKANNVARVLARLGRPVTATGFAGGHAGRFVQGDLVRLGIATDYEPIDGETRTCMAIVDPEGGSLTELREKGPAVTAGDSARFLARFERLLPGATLVVMSGSLPPGIDPGIYGALISIARSKGVRVILDASGRAFREALSARPFLVKPNRDELEEWVGEPIPTLDLVVAAARRLLGAGPEHVVVSLGAEGLLLVTPDRAWQAVPPAVHAINTVGSGDSAVAGLAAGLTTGLSLEAALRLGVACGTANAVTRGVAEVDPDVVERLCGQVRVREITP